MAVVASVFKVGWCLMSSSTALPKLDAVSPESRRCTPVQLVGSIGKPLPMGNNHYKS